MSVQDLLIRMTTKHLKALKVSVEARLQILIQSDIKRNPHNYNEHQLAL